MDARRRHGTLDFWRGVALVSIFVNHVPGNLLENLTHKNIGFSDGAEAFVFLAGVSLALAYYPRLPDGNLLGVAWRCVKRAFHLYKVHLVLTAAAVAFFALVSVAADMADLLEEHGRGTVFHDTTRGVAGMLFLGHQLGYFNILPMYVALLLWAPVAFALIRVHPLLALGASAGVYVTARLSGLNLPSWPEPGGWFFNPFAWQLIFTLGLLAGICAVRGTLPASRPLVWLAAAVLGASGLAATDGLGLAPGLWHEALQSLDTTKSNLGLARLIHFVALAYLLSQLPIGAALARTATGRELQRMGRQALPTFAVGSMLSVVGQAVMALSAVKTSASPALVGMIFTIFGLVGLLLLARYLEWSSAHGESGSAVQRSPRSRQASALS